MHVIITYSKPIIYGEDIILIYSNKSFGIIQYIIYDRVCNLLYVDL